MASSQIREHEQHILLLPFMAQGHLNPFIALARSLERRANCIITFVNTPTNIQKLKAAVPPDSTIHFAEIPFNSSDHGLPPNCESTDVVPGHLIFPLIQASETLRPAFEHLISDMCRRVGRAPLCIISDEFMSWSVESARKFEVFHCVVCTSGAYGTGIFLSIMKHLPHKKTDSHVFALPDFQGITLHRTQLTKDCEMADGSDPWSLLIRKHIGFFHQTDGMLVNTVEELETRAVDYFRNNVVKRAWSIGPLLRQLPSMSSCTDWLNYHPPNSVLYISFGSENSIHPSQMTELAKGLEASGKPFIWVVRPPNGFNVKGNFRAEWLPEGFEDRVTDQEKRQGLLMKNWAPQMEILSHKSTGGFLSHCGWNSILESLKESVPIIGWPMAAEQHFNMKYLVEELGVGVEIARGLEAEIHGDDITQMVNNVMDQESGIGIEMRRKAKEVQELIKAAIVEEGSCKGSSIRALDEFLQTVASQAKK